MPDINFPLHHVPGSTTMRKRISGATVERAINLIRINLSKQFQKHGRGSFVSNHLNPLLRLGTTKTIGANWKIRNTSSSATFTVATSKLLV